MGEVTAGTEGFCVDEMMTTLKSFPSVVSADSGAGEVIGSAISVTDGEISETEESVDSSAD